MNFIPNVEGMQSPIQHGPTRSWFHIRSGNQWGIQSEESRHICGWPSSWELPQPSSLIKGEGWFFKLRTVNVGFGFAKKTRCFRGLTTRHLLQPYSCGVTNPTCLPNLSSFHFFESFGITSDFEVQLVMQRAVKKQERRKVVSYF